MQQHYDEEPSAPRVFACLRQAKEEELNGVIVACFDDLGIGSCHEVFSGLAVGVFALLWPI